MHIKKVSIVIPCFNEEETIGIVVKQVCKYQKYLTEMIVINHDKNFGKCKALNTGIKNATSEIVIIQDADLEHSPKDFDSLLKPFEEANADIVYGSTFLAGNGYVRLHYYYHYLANKILTTICNIFTNLNMSDMETGYKVFRREVITSINLKENSFIIEPEIMIKLAKKKYKFFKVGISYRGRSYSEGKKITIKDAFIALYCIFQYSFFNK